MLPRVKIQYLNGQLGTVTPSADGLLALVVGAAAVEATFALNKAYRIESMDDLAALGVTEANNAALYKDVKEFYDEAESGTPLIVYGVAPSTTMSELCDYTKDAEGHLRHLITSENGALKGILIGGVNTTTEEANKDGLDPDVFRALPLAQQVGEWATTTLYAPLFIVLEGHNFAAADDLKDLSEETYNRVGILLGDTVPGSKRAAIGMLAGRIASIGVQRNIGRVADGALFPSTLYLGEKKVDDCQSYISAAYDKRYITPRTYVGKSGYFFTDDNLACVKTDDYCQLAPRRVVDKAYRIGYAQMLNYLLDEIELNEDGTMQAAVAKSWQQSIENAINLNMTKNGELSAGEDGTGCKVYIDETQNVLSTSTVKINIGVRPLGYSRYIECNLGFLTKTTNA